MKRHVRPAASTGSSCSVFRVCSFAPTGTAPTGFGAQQELHENYLVTQLDVEDSWHFRNGASVVKPARIALW